MNTRKHFFDLVKQIANEKKLKFLASSRDVYSYDNEFMWKIHLIPYEYRVKTSLYRGTPEFDDLLVFITNPGTAFAK